MLSLFKKPRELSLGKKVFILTITAILAVGFWLLYALNGLRIFVPYYPFISGFPFQSKNYLVVFQNNAELRPGGGFMTAYGVLRFVSGIPVGFEVKDIFSLSTEQAEYIEPPYPMGELLKSPFYHGWAFQDSNWFADFPTSAQKAIWFYNRAVPQDHVDGVIAVNFSVMESILEILGDVQVNGTIFNRANLFSQLEYTVSNIDRHNVSDLQQRKDVLKHFYMALLTHAALSPIQYNNLSTLLEQKLADKEIQLYFEDTILANMVNKKGWGGKLPAPTSSDFLAVVESNLAGMKSDRYLQRSVDYIVDIDGKVNTVGQRRAKATVSITLSHQGDYNEPLSYTYKGFVRVLIPKDSLPLQKTDVVEAEENGFKTLGRKVTIAPGGSQTITFEYILPPETVTNDMYQLHLNKQSGTNDMYNLVVHTPPDFILQGNNWQLRDNVATHTDILEKDLDLSLAIEPDHLSPRVTFQIFKDLQTIELHFNEAVTPQTCENINNYKLADGNITSSQTDMIQITNVRCTKTIALLSLKGVTFQPEEQYRLQLQNIQDIYGNVLSPSPKTITVVQRFEQ